MPKNLTVDYRVRPVIRYQITRYEEERDGDNCSGMCESLGEFDSLRNAERVARGLLAGEPHATLTSVADE